MEQQEEKVVSFFRFEDLRIYGKATDYASWAMAQLSTPRNEAESALVNSFCHSAYDIALNIAEGSSRSKSQFDHYLKISKTAIRECVVYTEVAHNLGMFGDGQYEQSREYLMELTRMIGALIISLQRSAERRMNSRDDEDTDSEADPYGNDEMKY
ncbi:MAG: four helix bundle protein [Bacteroidales bacterium]|nr:four helix bundle protein [Bacteroidales bacterium]